MFGLNLVAGFDETAARWLRGLREICDSPGNAGNYKRTRNVKK
jgi:hypothetical protein